MVEYDLLEYTDGPSFLAQLNAMAKEGWRVVGFSAQVTLDWTVYLAVLEREVPDSKEA